MVLLLCVTRAPGALNLAGVQVLQVKRPHHRYAAALYLPIAGREITLGVACSLKPVDRSHTGGLGLGSPI